MVYYGWCVGAVSTLAGGTSGGNVDGQGTVARFNSPVGVAVSSAGVVFVSDYYNHKIRMVTSAGEYISRG